jgi:hypothetical protein
MKRVLTRTGFADFVELRARNRKRWVLGPVQTALRSRGYTLAVRNSEGSGSPWHNRTSACETIISIPRLDSIQECVESVLVDDVPGDLVEVGAWRGGGSIFLRAVLAAYGVRDRRVWVADSFAGFPDDSHRQPADRGVDFGGGLGEGFFAVDLETVKANFARYELLDDQVKFLEGWFSDTLPAAPVETIALLLLDGDLFGSTHDALSALYPKVSKGGFVIVDDYGWHDNCRRAVDEFRAENGIRDPLVTIDDQLVLWRRAP